MNEDVIKLNDILLNNFYLSTKKILTDVCNNLTFLYNTQNRLYNYSNDYSNIIYKGSNLVNNIFFNAFNFNIDLCGNQNVTLDYSFNLIYNDLGFVITRKNNVANITQVQNTTKLYTIFNLLDISVQTLSDLCLNKLGNYFYKYFIKSNNNDLSFTLTRNITIRDIESPIIDLSGRNMIFEVYQLPSWFSIENNYGATISDNYTSIQDLSLVITSQPLFDISKVNTYTFTYRLTDTNGNLAIATRTVNVIDTTSPIIDLSGRNMIFEVYQLPSWFSIENNYGATISDNYSLTQDLSLVVTSQPLFDISNVGTYTFTYTLTDKNGNLAIATRTVNVIDTTSPIIDLSSRNMIFEVYKLPSWFSIENNYGATISDNYTLTQDLSLVVTSQPLFDISKVNTYTFTYRLTDTNGNVAIATRIVKVIDSTSPTFELIGSNPLYWNANVPYKDPGIDPYDNYDLSLTLIVQTDLSVNSVNVIGQYYYKYFIIDDYDNSVNITRRVYIIDYSVIQNIPVINISAEASNNITNIIDNVMNTEYFENNTLALSNNFAINLQNDNYNYVIPLDKLKAMYSKNNNMFIFIYGFKNEIISIINSSELTNYKFPYISSKSLKESFTKSVNLILDNSNNYKLIVLDGKYNPYLSVFDPSLTILGANPYDLQINTTFIDPGAVAFDYCGNNITNLINTQTNLDITKNGKYEVLYIANDVSGHQTIKNRIVNVYDSIAPFITLIGNSVITHLVKTPYIDLGVTVTDNGDSNPILEVINPVNINVVGTYTVTYNARDNCGNIAIPVLRTVNVIDNISPVITLNGSSVYNLLIDSINNYDLSYDINVVGGVNVTDNYDTAIDLSYITNIDLYSKGLYNFKIIATDDANNSSNVTRQINVINKIKINTHINDLSNALNYGFNSAIRLDNSIDISNTNILNNQNSVLANQIALYLEYDSSNKNYKLFLKSGSNSINDSSNIIQILFNINKITINNNIINENYLSVNAFTFTMNNSLTNNYKLQNTINPELNYIHIISKNSSLDNNYDKITTSTVALLLGTVSII